jgi:hypothetical protein
MRLAVLVLCSLLTLAPSVQAQRRAASSVVDVAVMPDESRAYQYTVSVVARVDADVVADLRWLHLEVRPAGSRRALSCDSPARPRRVSPDAVRTLSAGETWTETFDVRTICWGRALAALSAGGELGGSLGTTRSHAGARAAGSSTFRPVRIAFTAAAAVPAPTAPEGDVHVSLASADALSGARITLRVTVRANRAVRAWVRPDRVRFRVLGPDGSVHTCAMSRAPGAPIPDLFARIGTRSGPLLSLDARAYCAPDVFAAAGIYEVTPLLDLDVDGARWRLDTPRGTFEGAPTAVRVRTSTGRRG